MDNQQNTPYTFGWLPDLPDQRDFMYAAPMAVMQQLPTTVDLRSQCPPVYDQGHLGSCTANSLAGAYEFDLKKETKPDYMPSRLFIYYNERVLINTVNSDSGAYIRDGIKTMNNQGVCPEKDWPYDISKFTNKPSQKCYDEAKKSQIKSYQRLVNSLTQLKGCLAEGFPFVFGFTVYESFMTQQVAQTGIMPMPQQGEKTVGGHAVMAVGYDDSKNAFIIRNSWNTTWGIKGYFYMPYAYITNSSLCDDFWTIRLV
ncbi:C1 family peptidase [Mucilaginibacter arboris]|uniref:Peptidase n=1 Tax=Mucilaginibacter arboris TaxID=2682090 RepID=A0A7K1ST69_9SPHI|nr:C1 family peptidase [Mucilaginibacter arboris]MVN20508.1 peptidase [Mucilaginibacter arboris]